MPRQKIHVIVAQWPAPERVRAFTTTRIGGVSTGSYAALNLGSHVGDDSAAVTENRRRLVSACSLPGEPVWLSQTHGTRIVNATTVTLNSQADASFSDQPGVVCTVLTADCLPLFLCNRNGNRVGIVHIGWRGLAAGIVEKAVGAFAIELSDVVAWLGPAIGPQSFEIGGDVKHALRDNQPEFDSYFAPASRKGKWMADLYGLISQHLHFAGVNDCYYDDSLCTYQQPDLFFSYRRDRNCGRMASLIWIDP